MNGYQFKKRELQEMDTIQQSWSGDELKIQNKNVRVWLTHRENRAYDGDYQIEINVDERWICESFSFAH